MNRKTLFLPRFHDAEIMMMMIYHQLYLNSHLTLFSSIVYDDGLDSYPRRGQLCLISLESTIYNYPAMLENYKNVNFEQIIITLTFQFQFYFGEPVNRSFVPWNYGFNICTACFTLLLHKKQRQAPLVFSRKRFQSETEPASSTEKTRKHVKEKDVNSP